MFKRPAKESVHGGVMLGYVFILFALLFRFIPGHPYGFTPVTAALLFFGAYRPQRQFWIPLALLAGSDVILTKFVYAYPLTWDHYVTFLWYAAMLWLGKGIFNDGAAKRSPLRIGAAALAGSVSFFLVSNFAVWASWPDMYARSFGGIMTCYAAGLPFFRRAVAGDLLFTAVMFAAPLAAHFVLHAARHEGDRTAAA